MKRYNKKNLLPFDSYIITEALQNILESKELDINSLFYNNNFYLVVFRILNINKVEVVYNYIRYNELFLNPLLVILLARSNTLNIYREPGYFLNVLDDGLANDKSSNKSPLYLSEHSSNIGQVFENLDYQVSYTKPLLDVLNIISRLVYIANQDIMYKILEHAVHKRYMPFIKIIIVDLLRYPYLISQDFTAQEKSDRSIVNSCVFIVKNKDKLIKKIATNKSFENINTGSQNLRG